MTPRPWLPLWLWLSVAYAEQGSHFLGHSPPVVATPWRRTLLPCECTEGGLDCSARGLSEVDIGVPCDKTALDVSNNALVAFPNRVDTLFEVVNASANRLTLLPSESQLGVRVTELDLSYNRIADVGVDELRGLGELRSLYLQGNQGIVHLRFLPDPCILEHFEAAACSVNSLDGPLRRCFDLHTLDVSFNKLGPLSEDAFTPFVRLRVLDLSWNRLAPFPPRLFSNLSELTELRLDGVGLRTVPQDLFDRLSHLQFLSLDANDLRSISGTPFHGLRSLNYLSLANTSLSALPDNGFGNLSSLEELHLNKNKLSTLSSAAFVSLSRLKLINLSANNISVLPADVFRGLSELDTLFLEANNPQLIIQLGVVSSLSSLQLISLSHNLFTSLILHEMTNVRYIQCQKCGISSLHSSNFHNLEHLIALSIMGDHILSVEENTFVGLSHLTHLSLDGNRIQSFPSKIFSPLQNLTRLYLSRNLLTILPYNIFKGLNRVSEIALDYNALSELSEDMFRDTRSLQRLDISHNCLNALPQGIFSNLSVLWELNVAYNKISTLPSFPPDCVSLRAVSFERNSFYQLDKRALSSWLHANVQYLFLNILNKDLPVESESVGWLWTETEILIQRSNEELDGCPSILQVRCNKTLIRLCVTSNFAGVS